MVFIRYWTSASLAVRGVEALNSQRSTGAPFCPSKPIASEEHPTSRLSDDGY